MKRIAAGLAGSVFVFAAHAGVYVEVVNHDLRTGTTDLSQKIYVQGGMGRFTDGEGRSSLIKGGTMYILDETDKTYIAFDKATMEKLAAKLNAGMEKMKEQIAKLPPDQRAQLERELAKQTGTDGKGHTVEAVDTGKTDKVDARTCKVWDIKRNDELDDQLCVVPFAALPGKENFQAMFAEFAKVFEEMAKSVPMLAGTMTNEFSALNKVNGYPMRTRAYDNGKLGDEEQLVKIWREEAIPAAMFEIPADYHPKQMGSGPGAH